MVVSLSLIDVSTVVDVEESAVVCATSLVFVLNVLIMSMSR